MVFNGGTHILPMSVAALGTFAFCAAVARRDWRPVAFVAVFGIAAIAYSAPKLLPVAQFVAGEQFWDTRNPIEKPDRMTVEMLHQTYLVPTQQVGGRLDQQRHGWHEYGNYIGIGSTVAIVIGLLFVLIRRAPAHHWFGVSLAVTTIVLFLLSLGEFGPYAPAVLSQQLPLFENFRIPSRYTIPFLQFATLTLGWAFHSIVSRHGLARPARIAIAIVCVIASAHLIAVNRWNLRNVFNQPAFDTTFRWQSGPREIATDKDSNAYAEGSPMLRALVEHRAFFYCYESLQLQRAAVPDRPHLFVEGTARISDVDFSPNRLSFNVFGGPEPAKLLLNYNWGPGWSTTAGDIELMGEPGKLATVAIAPGQTGRFAFTFTPPGLYVGSATFVLAALATMAVWRRRTAPTF
jgi:multisubunit Na+/H+ antiporter MnhC subunit